MNGEAARWADQHQAMLPIDPVDLWPAEDVDRPRIVQNLEDTAKTEGERQCANCGNRGAQTRLQADSGGRLICSDCAAKCPRCSALLVMGEQLCAGCCNGAAKYLEQARNALAQQDAAKARVILDTGLREFPGAPDLSEEAQSVTAAIKRIEETTTQLKQRLKDRCYVAARKLADNLKAMPVHVGDLQRAVELCVSRCAKAVRPSETR